MSPGKRRLLVALATTTVMVVMAGTALLGGPWSFSPMHKANVREAEVNIAKVERYCGKDRAAAFREVIDPDDNTEIPMREWVKRCLTESGR